MAVKASNQAPENGRDNGRDASRNRRTVPNSPTAQSVAREDSWEAEQDNNIVPLTRAEAEKLFVPNVIRP